MAVTRFLTLDGEKWTKRVGIGWTPAQAWAVSCAWRERQRKLGHANARFEIWRGEERLYPVRGKQVGKEVEEGEEEKSA